MENKWDEGKWLEQLYMRTKKMSLKVVKDGKDIELDVYMVGADGSPDCQIGNFYRNFFIRTPKGQKREKYKTFKTMLYGIKKSLKPYNMEIKEITLVEKYAVRADNIVLKFELAE